MQSCCFAHQPYCFYDVLVAVASLDLKVPIVYSQTFVFFFFKQVQ